MMKRLFLIGLFLLTACLSPSEEQSAPPEPSPEIEVTTTRVDPNPVPATVTPTIQASPTATVTSLPPERYFTEEFDAAPVHWSTLYASGDSSRVDLNNEDGVLSFGIYSQNTWLYAIYSAFEYESVHLETRVESSGSEENSVGLVCNYNEQDGWYEFNISGNGTYNLLHGQWLADGIAQYAPILNDSSDQIAGGNSINEIGMDCYDDVIQLYINGKIIRKINVAHIGLSNGKVGLSLASFDKAPVILAFDWVKVNRP